MAGAIWSRVVLIWNTVTGREAREWRSRYRRMEASCQRYEALWRAAARTAARAEAIKTETAVDARVRVLNARIGSLAPPASDEYLLRLEREILVWAEAVRGELDRRCSK